MNDLPREKNFENKVKKFLKEQNAYFIKYWGGAMFTKAGVPDLLACVDGHFIGIELKAPNGKPSALQIYNLKEIENAGGYAILLYPNYFEVFKNFILCIKEGNEENIELNYQILKGEWC